MKKAQFMLDTVILIDHLNGIQKATDFLLSLKEGEAVISVITRAEVMTGVNDEEKSAVTFFLDNYKCLSIGKNIADRAAELRKANKWKLPDAFQAAAALENKLLLMTRNTKDFDEAKHAFVKIPYRI
jgi:predicted nucleic acid-binding protein